MTFEKIITLSDLRFAGRIDDEVVSTKDSGFGQFVLDYSVTTDRVPQPSLSNRDRSPVFPDYPNYDNLTNYKPNDE